jgi:hypothetical protein
MSKPFELTDFLGEPHSFTFDPPSCPVSRHGVPIDILHAPIEVYVIDSLNEEPPTTLDIWLTFGGRDTEGDLVNFIETDVLRADVGDPLLATASDIERAPQDPRLERIRQELCSRVVQCPGPVDGECWALGTQAVAAVFEQAGNAPPAGE